MDPITQPSTPSLRFVGFWARVLASFIDSVLLLLIIVPLLNMVYGGEYWESPEPIKGPMDLVISWLMPAVVVVLFWMYRQATPGKMAISASIVDAETGQKPSDGQFIGRYFGYFVSTLPLGLGFLWVAFDRRKQGWHDKLAGTVVVYRK